MIWRTSPALTLATACLRLVRAMLPVATLFVGKLIIDEVVRRSRLPAPAGDPWRPDLWRLGVLLGTELLLALLADALGRAVSLLDQLLSDRFSDETSLRLMQHAATLDLRHFEDSETQDKLDRARRQASGRSGLVSLLLGQAQDLVTLAGFAAGIAAYAPWLILLLAAALVPAFLGEIRFNRLAYAMDLKRTRDRRELDYLRQTGASTSTAKEVKLFGLHGFLIGRYRELADAMRRENAAFAWRRAASGAALAAVGTLGYYAAYAYLAWRAVAGGLTLGDLTFLAASFQRLRGLLAGVLTGLSSLASQALYLQDLFSFLDLRAAIASPADGLAFPAALCGGIEFQDVGFRYPDAPGWAMRHLSFRLEAGRVLALVGENGAGKTTLVKLLTRLYDPDEGRILVDGHDLREYDLDSLRAGIGVIFQDFVRYDLSAADNIAVGRIGERANRGRIEQAAALGRADAMIGRLAGRLRPDGRAAVPRRRGAVRRRVAESGAGPRLHARRGRADTGRADRSAGCPRGVRGVRALQGAERRPHGGADLPPLLLRADGRPDSGGGRRPGGGERDARGAGSARRALCRVVPAAGCRLPVIPMA